MGRRPARLPNDQEEDQSRNPRRRRAYDGIAGTEDLEVGDDRRVSQRRVELVAPGPRFDEVSCVVGVLAECPVPLTGRGTQTLVSFAPLAFKLFYAARQNAVLKTPPPCPIFEHPPALPWGGSG